MTVTTVLFDVGETLVDETRQWEGWARWLGVPTPWFFAALGAVIGRGAPHTDVFTALGHPGIDLAVERRRRTDAGDPDEFDEQDLYPDARACLDGLTRRGLTVGIAANQPAHREAVVRQLFPGVEVVLLSGALGVEKPDPLFFERSLTALSVDDPAEVAYVGDRLDNDVLPAIEAGMVAIHLRRGPWGVIHAARPEAARARLRIDGLAEMADALAGLT